MQFKITSVNWSPSDTVFNVLRLQSCRVKYNHDSDVHGGENVCYDITLLGVYPVKNLVASFGYQK